MDLKTILELIRVSTDVAKLPNIEDFNDFLRWCRALGKLLNIVTRFTKTEIDDRVVSVLNERMNDEGVMRIIHGLVLDVIGNRDLRPIGVDVYGAGIDPAVIMLIVELVVHILKLLRNT